MSSNHHRTFILTLTISLFSIWLIPSSVSADTVSDTQTWTGMMTTAKLGSDRAPFLWTDLHMRRGGPGTTYLIRPGVGLNVKPWLSVLGGYASIPVDRDEAEGSNEHRIWQQVVLRKVGARLSLSSRTRFEQRFGDGASDVGLRLRELVRVAWQPRDGSAYGLVTWDELFIGLNDTDWGAQRGFDQNRLFAGAYVKLQSTVRVELGYLFVFLERGDTDIAAHALATNVFLTLNP